MKKVSVFALLAAAGAAMAQPAGTTYVAANWAAPGLINYLDGGLVSLGSFNAGNATGPPSERSSKNNRERFSTITANSIRNEWQ